MSEAVANRQLPIADLCSPTFYLQSILRALSIFRSRRRVSAFGATAPVRVEMKNTACKTLITLTLVLIALVPAYAQKTSATVNIPFSFTVDDVRMPAGEYIISSP